ncbi:hypothetical protein R6Q59_009959 [Mikania micrantha]
MKLSLAFVTFVAAVTAFTPGSKLRKRSPISERVHNFRPRQYPAAAVGVQTVTGPNGINITYKMPGSEGVCETTPGVKSYVGFVNLAPDVHSFFWFFESRRDPKNDPVTLWLNGGPGSDSMYGLFQELGPCNVTANLTTELNPYAWNNISNMLFLSQPIGTGFSYSGQAPGSVEPIFDEVLNASQAPPNGRYPTFDPYKLDTTDLAAVAAWEVIQAFYEILPSLDSNVTSKVFNLATESYGGHYGPAFFNYFQNQNQRISNGSAQGVPLTMNSLTIINGIIDEYIQVPYYNKFAVNNTYGIKAYNQTVYDYAEFALNFDGGCLAQIEACYQTNQSTLLGAGVCTEAGNMCRDNVEGPYYYFGERGVYDIRHPYADPTPVSSFIDYLNQPSIQAAIGVTTNYTEASNTDIYYAFQQTGDFVYPNFIEDLNSILNSGVRVSLIYGDADYICNWFGGEAVSLAANYTYSSQFRQAGYTPMTVNGVEYGETREYGNFSFTRVYEAGHMVPYYQPIAALQLFNRTINGFDTATGLQKVSANLTTNGTAQATHTEPYVALPSSTSAAASGSASSAPGMRYKGVPHWKRA